MRCAHIAFTAGLFASACRPATVLVEPTLTTVQALAAPLNASADRLARVAITVYVVDGSGVARDGAAIQYTADGCIPNAGSAVTDAGGTATFYLTSQVAGAKTVQVTALWQGKSYSATQPIWFTDTATVAPKQTAAMPIMWPSTAAPQRLTFSSSDAAAALPSAYTYTANDAGMHDFNVVFQSVGKQSVSAIDAATGREIATQQFLVQIGPAALLTVALPTQLQAGVPGDLSVTVQDAFGNLATDYAGTLVPTSSDANATLPASIVFMGGTGQETLPGAVAFTTLGAQTVTLTEVTAALAATSDSTTVLAGDANYFLVTGPATLLAGAPQAFTVTPFDAYGHVATGYQGSVGVTASDAQLTTAGPQSFAAAQDNTVTFNVALGTAGLQSITVTDVASAALHGTLANIRVEANAMRSLVIGFPATVTAGQQTALAVSAVDANANIVPSYNAALSVTSSDAAATLVSNANISAGACKISHAATFVTAGPQWLTVTAADSNHSTATLALSVRPAAPNKAHSSLQVTPTTQIANGQSSISATLQVRDIYNNLVPNVSSVFVTDAPTDILALPTGTTDANGRISMTFTSITTGQQNLAVIFANQRLVAPVDFLATPCTQGLSLAAPVTYTVGSVPQGVAMGDVTGDGLTDIVTANTFNQTLSILRNNGDGTFAPQHILVAGVDVLWVSLGDVTGDGKLDIVTVNETDQTVGVLRNLGNGAFAAQTTYACGTESYTLALGDMNNDGLLDVTIGNYGDQNIGLYINRGNGLYFPQITNMYNGHFPLWVATGDLNGDGNLDVVYVSPYGDWVDYLFNNGTGSFATQAYSHTANSQTEGPLGVGVGDFNGDHNLDVAVANQQGGANGVEVFINGGGGAFPISGTAVSAGSEPLALATADLDGDGDTDFAVIDYTDNTLSIYLNDGAANFAAPVVMATGSEPGNLVIGDLNADGKMDIAVVNENDSNVSVFMNTCQ